MNSGQSQDMTVSNVKSLAGVRVVDFKKDKQIGKISYLVFHSAKNNCLGFLVKRPDIALMFRQKDLFVSLDGFFVRNGEIIVRDGSEYIDDGACGRLQIDLDDCVIWQGMPVILEDQSRLGVLDDVEFEIPSGKVRRIRVARGATAKVLLGDTWIPQRMILGFRTGIGDALAAFGERGNGAQETRGAIVVSSQAANLQGDGGIAEVAGKATAAAAKKAKKAKDVARPKAEAASRLAGSAVSKGAFAAGRQIGKTKGMFAAFKSEYDKAVSDGPGNENGK